MVEQSLLEKRIQEKVEASQRGTSPSNAFIIEDILMFMSLGAQSLSQDEFSKCFEPKPIHVQEHLYGIWYILWLGGMIIRYVILFPLRLFILSAGLTVFLVSLLAARLFGKVDMERWLFTVTAKIWLFSYGAIIRHHGHKPKLPANRPHIFVANHTSFTDFIVLTSHEFPHGVVAQNHGGLFGVFMRYVLELYGSLSFNRNEQRDRVKIAERIKKHISNPRQFAPLLIFPEGTCVNNESTVLFHKRVFELNCTICPVGIKYNKKLLDPYWNTREQSFSQHVLYLMTRWMMMVDVWWLTPQERLPNETAIDFADRVKGMISHAAGLKNRSWNGYLKNMMRQMDRERMKRSSQSKYAGYLRVLNVSSDSMNLHTSSPSPSSASSPSPSPSLSAADMSIAQPIPIRAGDFFGTAPRSQRSSSFSSNGRSSSRYSNIPSTSPKSLEFPKWLSEAAIVDAKNSMMMSGSSLSKTSAQLTSLKNKLVASIRAEPSDDNGHNDAGNSQNESDKDEIRSDRSNE